MQVEDYEYAPFKDKPDLTTPIIAAALNHISMGVKENRDYIKQLNETVEDIKYEKAEGLMV